MDPYKASNGSCSMVTWIIKKKNHLLEVGLTQNRETMALWNPTTIDLFYFIMCKDPTWIQIHWNSIWLRARLHMTSNYTWGPMTTLRDFGNVLGQPLDGSCVKWPLVKEEARRTYLPTCNYSSNIQAILFLIKWLCKPPHPPTLFVL